MNTYIIEDVSAQRDETGISSVKFNFTVTNPAGVSLKTESSKFFPSPIPDRTEAGVIALAEQIVKEDNISGFADRALEKQIKGEFIIPPPPVLSDIQKREQMMVTVDDTIAEIITKKTRFYMGYIEREKAAREYTDSNFTIAPTEWITRFANNNNITYQTAAGIILNQAAGFRSALFALDNLRMDKYLIKNAATLEAAVTAFNQIETTRNQIEANLT